MEQTYGQRLREKSIGFLRGGQTKPKVKVGRDSEGCKTKSVTDELGNTVTEHNNSKDQVDVTIRAPHVSLVSKEERQ
jgi:hypothetical protein